MSENEQATAMVDITDDADAVAAILDANARATSRRYDRDARGRWQLRVELTIRPYRIPAVSRRLWAVVLNSDDLTVWGGGTAREARAAYEQLARDCEADYARDGAHAWHETDVRGIPQVTPVVGATAA